MLYIFLLFINMSNLEPDVFFIQWTWRIIDNILEALNYC